MINIEKMIGVVCGMIKREYGIDIERATNITDGEIKDEILRRVSKGEDIREVIEECKVKYAREKIDFSDKKKKPARR